MKNPIEESFKINIAALKIAGMYNYTSLLYKLHALFWYTLCIVLISVLGVVQRVKTARIDLDFSSCIVIELIFFSLKILPFILNTHQLHTCLYFLQDSYPNTPQVQQCTANCRKISTLYTLVLLTASSTLAVLILVLNKGETLFIDVWVPYELNGRFNFHGTNLVLLLSYAYSGVAGIMTDALIGGLAYHAATQLKVLKLNIKRLKGTADTYRKIIEFIDHHNLVLRFSAMYEECFSLPIFSQFAVTLLSVTFILGMFVRAPANNAAMLVTVAGGFFQLVEVFIYCHCGQILFEENNSMRDEIYQGDWYNYDLRSQKALITLMERAKTPIVIKTGKTISLTYETFTQFLKTIYSLLALILKFK